MVLSGDRLLDHGRAVSSLCGKKQMKSRSVRHVAPGYPLPSSMEPGQPDLRDTSGFRSPCISWKTLGGFAQGLINFEADAAPAILLSARSIMIATKTPQ
jgi:hypothetical protein